MISWPLAIFMVFGLGVLIAVAITTPWFCIVLAGVSMLLLAGVMAAADGMFGRGGRR